ncbi:protein ZBED8-like [Python bivittatus]|uniref:Protein ZBED8-like n=1 Tax=Python bivittatus TaxID=176946 RepID=A0A9F5N3M1_PYTBI|nr:protein ZBED8-like [Python bivittatus]
MTEDVEASLCKLLIPTEFSLQVDESTLPSTNEALLLVYVRFVKEGKIIQEMLFARSLIADTKDESIFNTVKDYFKEKNIPLANIMSVAIDGAPAMVSRHRGFITLLKKEVPGILAVHCMIHRQHLVAKNLSNHLHQSLQYVISAVNKIHSNALNNRLFGQLCKDNDEEFNRLLLHTKVRWLSKGAYLNRFWNLFDSVLEFLEEKDVALRDRLLQFKIDTSYTPGVHIDRYKRKPYPYVVLAIPPWIRTRECVLKRKKKEISNENLPFNHLPDRSCKTQWLSSAHYCNMSGRPEREDDCRLQFEQGKLPRVFKGGRRCKLPGNLKKARRNPRGGCRTPCNL